MFTARVMYMTKTITAVYGHCLDTSQTSTTLDTRTYLCTLYTMLTIVCGCTRVYASTNADLGAYAHRNIISIYGNFQEIHSKCILLASANVR